MSRYRESCRGCVINIVTERIDALGVEPMRRVRAVLITRNGVNLGYQSSPYAGPDEDEVVRRALEEARDFVSKT